MPFSWCDQSKRAASAKLKRDKYHVTHHGDALIVAALERRALSAQQAASIVAAGARADLGRPSEGLGPGDFVWRGDLYSAGVRFFAAAAVAAREKGAVAELARRKFTFVRAADLPGEAADFVRVLRSRAPLMAQGHAGATMVDGRVKWAVPEACVLRGVLAAFARVLRPDVFPASFGDHDFEMSFIYLTLLAHSSTQVWHRDYIAYPNAVVFLIMLDDGVGTTEWLVDGVVTKSDAKVGDVVPFIPSSEHRGVATGVVRRALYVSIRTQSRRK